MARIILKVGGMSCSACQNRVEKYLNQQDGVKASVNLVLQQALIEYDDSKLTIEDLNEFIKDSGYKSLGIYNEKIESKKDYTKFFLIIYLFLGLFLMYVSMGHMIGLSPISILSIVNHPNNYGFTLLFFSILFIVFGFDILKSGIIKLIHGFPNMDSLVSVGVLSSFFYSLWNLYQVFIGHTECVKYLYFESVAMVLYFIKLGRYIDKKSKEKSLEAIQELVQITPEKALLKRAKGEEEVTIDEVVKNDILICKPGMKFAVDGVIVKGSTHIDESFITGESRTRKKTVGDKVVAGSINLDGFIEYKAEKIGPDSSISEIVRLVVEASNTKAPIQRLVDKISSIFVPSIFIIAVFTLVIYLIIGKNFSEAIISFVTVLVVSCPCALGLATPLAVVISEGRSARDGILIRTSEVLEKAHKVDTIIFDKTGTLTYGKLKVSSIKNYSSFKDLELLEIVSSLEKLSTHPIATAFLEYDSSKLVVENFHNITGIGLSGRINQKDYYVGSVKLLKKLNIKESYVLDEKELSNNGNSIIYIIEGKKVIGLIGVSDIIRDDAKKTIQLLKKQGKRIIMLSGDNEDVANLIGKELKIDEIIANCLPTDKEKYLKKLKNDGCYVMMVGDGINDAPSLTSSDVGVSISGGTDIAANSSDVILMHGNLNSLLDLLNISKRTVHIIKENLFWAFFYNICMIPIAIGVFKPMGIELSPMIASLTMTISSLSVVFNSLRLRR